MNNERKMSWREKEKKGAEQVKRCLENDLPFALFV